MIQGSLGYSRINSQAINMNEGEKKLEKSQEIFWLNQKIQCVLSRATDEVCLKQIKDKYTPKSSEYYSWLQKNSDSNEPSITRALDETRIKLLTYKEKLFQFVFYTEAHSSNDIEQEKLFNMAKEVMKPLENLLYWSSNQDEAEYIACELDWLHQVKFALIDMPVLKAVDFLPGLKQHCSENLDFIKKFLQIAAKKERSNCMQKVFDALDWKSFSFSRSYDPQRVEKITLRTLTADKRKSDQFLQDLLGEGRGYFDAALNRELAVVVDNRIRELKSEFKLGLEKISEISLFNLFDVKVFSSKLLNIEEIECEIRKKYKQVGKKGRLSQEERIQRVQLGPLLRQDSELHLIRTACTKLQEMIANPSQISPNKLWGLYAILNQFIQCQFPFESTNETVKKALNKLMDLFNAYYPPQIVIQRLAMIDGCLEDWQIAKGPANQAIQQGTELCESIRREDPESMEVDDLHEYIQEFQKLCTDIDIEIKSARFAPKAVAKLNQFKTSLPNKADLEVIIIEQQTCGKVVKFFSDCRLSIEKMVAFLEKSPEDELNLVKMIEANKRLMQRTK